MKQSRSNRVKENQSKINIAHVSFRRDKQRQSQQNHSAMLNEYFLRHIGYRLWHEKDHAADDKYF